MDARFVRANSLFVEMMALFVETETLRDEMDV